MRDGIPNLPENVNGSVFITDGAQDWQIFQKNNIGVADIMLTGYWRKLSANGSECVYVRLVCENTGRIIKSFAAANTVTSAENCNQGTWSFKIEAVPCGGLYRIETCLLDNGCDGFSWAHRGDMRHHIGVGDVFLIIGQSNATGIGRDSIPDAPCLGVHMLRHNGKWDIASHPLADSTDTAMPLLQERINPGHSPYLAAAKILNQALGYPIGLMPFARGGSAMSSWHPDEHGELFTNLNQNLGLPAANLIRGIFWYQGCTDAFSESIKATSYLDRFTSLVKHLRVAFADDKLPIFTVQLNKYRAEQNKPKDAGWGLIREAQRQAARLIDNVFICPSIDVPLGDIIHNSAAGNLMLAQRLAAQVLHHMTNSGYSYKAPDIEGANVIQTDTVTLTFSNVLDRLSTKQISAKDLPFDFVDQLGRCEPTSYLIEHNRIHITLSRNIKLPANVSFAWRQSINLEIPFDTGSCLPVLAFYEYPIREEI